MHQRRNRIRFLEPVTFLIAPVLLLLLPADVWNSPGLNPARAAAPAASTSAACPVHITS